MFRSRVRIRRSNSVARAGSSRSGQLAPRPDRGATLVEAAFVFPLLFVALFAIIEFGLAFKDYLSVSHAARDGARAGATYGNDPRADILILRDIQATLATIGIADSITVRIFDPNNPTRGTEYTYQEGAGMGCDWVPCPDPDLPSPPYQIPAWDPGTRDISAPFTDRIAVEVSYQHQWLTSFFLDTTDFTVEADFQIEPQVFDP